MERPLQFSVSSAGEVSGEHVHNCSSAVTGADLFCVSACIINA